MYALKGVALENQLLQLKPTKIDGLCVFTFNKNSELIFIAAPEFCKQNNLRQKNVPIPADNASTKLNMIQIGKLAGVDRSVADSIITKLIESIGRLVKENKSILLSFHHIGELRMLSGEISFSYHPNMASITPGAVIASNKAAKDSEYLSMKAAAVPRARNPITGEFDAGDSLPAAPPARKDRNPLTDGNEATKKEYFNHHNDSSSVYSAQSSNRSASIAGKIGAVASDSKRRAQRDDVDDVSISTMSLMHSPRSQYSLQSSTAYPPKPPRPMSGNNNTGRLTSASLQAHQLKQGAPADARLVAAKALSNRPSTAGSQGNGVTTNASAFIDRFRNKIIERGGATGIRGLGKLLSIMDDNGDKRLSKDEFK